ncbi:8-amino-7-oxononanoate synthase [Novosphingobium sp. NDB2Meth1]|uniref:8-amino-7-oxononanoate synthase n=1 Tax=Novosphingobium sp. NDB2Meth1 TaxID=1892847 RepID=UPI0009305A47|nr:8-amino-7-oxononanoate synthase [Novosphingobium sp. NDB2Meth1]
MDIWQAHRADLDSLAARGRRRQLILRRGRDFSSNDYLGMSGAPRLARAVEAAIARGVPMGSGGSRLLRGNDPEHEALEADAARFFSCESTLFLSSGYAANVALLATLPQRGDLVVYDALIHASMHEGLALTRADKAMAAHNNVQSFADAITAWRTAGGRGRAWLAFESLYSMDGDRAPLADLAALAERHEAVMLIDEAHATGVFGPDGRGLAAALDGRADTVVLRTCGKALGCEGALICGPSVVRDFLVNRARPFIFSTAPSPLMAAAVREALRMLVDEPERRTGLMALAAHAGKRLAPLGAEVTGTQIMPLILGDEARTMAVAALLQEAGFDVRGIRPPTVPTGTSRLRISLTQNVIPQDIDALAEALAKALA